MRAVNLLPPDTRGASKASAELGAGPEAKGGAGAFVVLGVLAACVAGVAGHVLSSNTIKQRQADLTEVTVRQQALQSQATQLKPYADFDAAAKARVQTVRDLAGSRFDWERSLRDLARAVPSDVTLLSLNGDISTDAGGGGSGLRAAISAPAITIAGCAPGQTQVARLMARLHDIDGVTRVSLSRSTAEEVKVDGASGSKTAQRNAAPCGEGKRPSFEMVMFFEKDAAAVASTPTTASGTVAATPTPAPTATPAPGTTAAASTTTTTTQAQGGATP
jgi:Tfp pilus assembly protein PilN